MKIRFWGIVRVMLGLLVGLSLAQVSRAATTGPSNNIGFSVSAQLPKNQVNTAHTYFDLQLSSGQSQTLKAVIYNVTNRDIQVKTGIHTAYTNGNGVIEYVKPTTVFDPSLKLQIGQLTRVQGKSVVTVPANGTKVVTAQVKIPKTAFQGTMLGGWYFEKLTEKVTSEVKGSMNVRNQYSYVIGMKYSLGKTPKPALKLGQVEPKVVNEHQAIVADLRNVSATINQNLSLTTTITSKATGDVVKTVKKASVQLAPNTVYHYPLLTGTSALKSGHYQLKMIVKGQSQRWVLEKDFTITASAAKKLAHQSVENKGLNSIWLVVAGAVGMLVIGGLLAGLVFFLRKRRRDE